MLEEGMIVELNNFKKYIVINVFHLHAITYVFLVSMDALHELVIATSNINNNELVLKEIKDNSELDYILSQFVLTK